MQGVELLLAAAERKINNIGFFEDGNFAEFHVKWLAFTAFGGQRADRSGDVEVERTRRQDRDMSPEHAAGF
jgi:hypothetical protein